MLSALVSMLIRKMLMGIMIAVKNFTRLRKSKGQTGIASATV
jgi:hypothetical protein